MKSRRRELSAFLLTAIGIPLVLVGGGLGYYVICRWSYWSRMTLQNGDIRLFARVVDQYGGGVPGVNVDCDVQVSDAPYRGHREHFSLVTDSQGRFSVSDRRGIGLTIHVSKEGYSIANTPGVFGYGPEARVEPGREPETPLVIAAWKKGIPEPLVQVLRSFDFVADGRFYTVDLLTGKQQEGRQEDGDLWIRIKRSADVRPYMRVSWLYELEVPNGGLIVTDEPMPYAAPSQGYASTFTFESMADRVPAPDPRRRFYVRSRGGRVYSFISVTASPGTNGSGRFSIDSLANPAGSGVLEPSPDKVTRR